MNTDILFELVEQYDIITIYRHVSPDADALGAQFGLKQWIQETYPQKQVYALGRDAGSKQSLFPQMDVVPDETVAASLAIILDTANGARVDDDRWSKAVRTLKIDHHIVVESFADVEVVEDLFGATCEMLAYMFEQKQLRLSATCAQYLYGGIIADITTPDNASCRASSIQHQWAAAVYAVSLSAIRICSLYSSGTSKQRNNGKEQESPFHEESCSSGMRYASRITRILCFSSVLSGCSLRNSYENIVSIQSLFLCLKFYHSLHHLHNLL